MREAFAGLTVRGRAFLAAGITAIVCAVLLGQPALTRVGVLVVALPVVTAVVIGRSRYRLALVRTVTPQLVSAGQPARVHLALTNEGRTPSGVLMLEDHVPYVLGTRPRFVLDGIGHGWRRQVTYQVRSDVRGRFEIGPMTVRVGDGFGLVELGRAFRMTVPLVVTPRTVPLPAIPLGGGWTGSGDNRPRAFAIGSAEDVTVRDYRQGDDLRRVHWRSSAKTGELMVRREEQPWQSRATILLDNRLVAHRGQGVASSLEAAVSAAASIALHLSHRGFQVRLVTAGGEDSGGPSLSQWHSRDADLNVRPLLEALAVVELDSRDHLDTSWMGEAAHGGLTVAVLGSLDQRDGPALRRIVHHTASALAVALDVDAWSGPHVVTGSAAPFLTGSGWRAVTLGPRDRLETVWEDLGRSSARGASRARTAAVPS
ncbi:DUF58 domain-containing protein [Nocardioides dongxiaopingii]|uniref:DUF58 domain-containing protein n=1 Tax=Nocardioides TaxID=1839 RepID=UPI0010C76778|nr:MULTISPECIES: DUF58 domain-containing protein [Nocardioides]QCW51180.1 DUF58 domain-containing protein [Nocardioides sp. S-1144]